VYEVSVGYAPECENLIFASGHVGTIILLVWSSRLALCGKSEGCPSHMEARSMW
jgi:hypothetical protein